MPTGRSRLVITHCPVVKTSTIPPFAVTAPDGERVVVHPHAATDTVDELARALDLPTTMPLVVDGRPVGRHQRLLESGLRVGSRLDGPPVQPERDRICGSPHDGEQAGDMVEVGVGGMVEVAVEVGVEVAVSAGPACVGWQPLEPGRHAVGRAPSAVVRIDDPGVELHHGVLDVDIDGAVRFTQLTGRTPAGAGWRTERTSEPAGITGSGSAGSASCGSVSGGRIDAGVSIGLGSSELVVRTASAAAGSPASTNVGSVVPAERDPWRRVVRRGPATVLDMAEPLLDIPELPAAHRAPPLTSLVGAGVAVAGAGLLAAVLGQALFALFALVGAVASLATWAVGAFSARRNRLRAEREHRDALAEFASSLARAHRDAERHHRRVHLGVVDALGIVAGDGGDFWSRRSSTDQPLRATVGRGTCRWRPPVDDQRRALLDPNLLVRLGDCERLEDVPVPVELSPASVLALHGPMASGAALTRSILVQLATLYGPSDWQIVVVSDQPDRWEWVSWLPHARGGAASVVDAGDAHAVAAVAAVSAGALPVAEATEAGVDSDRHLVVVLDAAELLTARTGPLRRRLERGDAACIVMVPPEASVPAMATRVLAIGSTGRARWSATAQRSSWALGDSDIRIAGISTATADAAARRLAPLIDPEDDDGCGGVPASVALADIEPEDTSTSTAITSTAITSTAIVRRWRRAGADPAPVARLGLSADGVVDIDLVRDGPHGLLAGTTGSGKSELLRTLVVSLAAHTSPDHLTMVLVDFKGGSTFDACERLPHTVGVVTDLDDGLAERVLVSLDAEVRRRERLLRAASADDLTAYRRSVEQPLARLVVVIDEFASLAKELPDFLHALVDIAQRGRSLGVHLLLATQRPAGVVTDDIRANTNLRIALRLQDRSDANDVIGDPAPARFAAGTPGRAVLRLGPGELVTFQTANSSGPVRRTATRLRIERCSNVHVGVGGPGGPGGESDVAGPTMLTQLVDAVCEAAIVAEVEAPHRPWVDPLPDTLTRRHLLHELGGDRAANGVVGLVDDPSHQRRRPLEWSPTDGNVLLVGSIGSGTTTAAAALVGAAIDRSTPSQLHVYVIDARGDEVWTRAADLAHCGAVVRLGELERLMRLLRRLAGELDRRATDGARDPQVVVVIDGIAAVRDALGDVAMTDTAMQLDRLVRDGPALGISICITTDGASSASLAVARSATWVFHLDDPSVGRTAGLRGAPVPADVPGRLRVVDSGLDAQVVHDPERFETRSVDVSDRLSDSGTDGAPAAIGVLPEVIDPDTLDPDTLDTDTLDVGGIDTDACDPSMRLLVGLEAADLEAAWLDVPPGDHVFIGGGSRTGRSTALRQLEASWQRRHPHGVVIRGGARHPPDLTSLACGASATVDDGVDTVASGVPVLVVVDDADRVDDHDGRLAALVAAHRRGLTVMIAARLEAVRVAYGHWTREVARSRCGLIMTSVGDIDGELLGATLPRRSMIPARPGLAWMIDQHGPRLVQVAARLPS